MDLTADHRFGAPVTRVIAVFADADFARARGFATGAPESEAIVDGGPDEGFTVTIRRTTPTDGVQPEFRPFIGPSIAIRYAEVWQAPEGDSRDATFAVEIVGAPVRAAGTLTLTPDGSGTVYAISGTVTAQIPFLGNIVTQAVVTALLDGLKKECSLADAWLARSADLDRGDGRSTRPPATSAVPLPTAAPSLHFQNAPPRPTPRQQVAPGHPLVDRDDVSEALPSAKPYTPRVSPPKRPARG